MSIHSSRLGWVGAQGLGAPFSIDTAASLGAAWEKIRRNSDVSAGGGGVRMLYRSNRWFEEQRKAVLRHQHSASHERNSLDQRRG
jgi:hypothetical protein